MFHNLFNLKYIGAFRQILVISAANALYALMVYLFLETSGIVTGGVTGISLALARVTGVGAATFAGVLNLLMWIIDFFLLGKNFAVTTFLSTVEFPLFLGVFEHLLPGLILTDDILLCTFFGGILMGISLGIIIREGSSTGGMDVIPLALNKYFRISVSMGMYVLDFLILLAQALIFPKEQLLYGILMLIIYTVVMDKILVNGKSRIEMKVISQKYNEIREVILHDADRGVTMLKAEGGYLHHETEMIMSIVSNRELGRIEKLIYQIDPAALIIVSRVSEVSGRGFTLGKMYL